MVWRLRMVQLFQMYYIRMSDSVILDKYVEKVSKKGRMLSDFKKGMRIRAAKGMAVTKDYIYVLKEAPGQGFAEGFTPYLTPAEMLFMGVFEGKYLTDCYTEFPKDWFLWAAAGGRLAPLGLKPDVSHNYFGVDSRQPLSVWRENGWVPGPGARREAGPGSGRDILADKVLNPDERGWFQWYCRYWMGRRIPDLDKVQINRWRSFTRHVGRIRHGCEPGDLNCHRRERQALLQWAYNPFI